MPLPPRPAASARPAPGAATIPSDVAAATAAAGISVEEVVQRTGKTLLARGTLGARRVAVKILLDRSDGARDHFQHEVSVYGQFAADLVPFPAPALLWADPDGIMALEWIPGHRLDHHRYPVRTLADSELDAVLDAVTTLNRWQPPPTTSFPTPMNYWERTDRYTRTGFFNAADRAALLRLLPAAGAAAPPELAHGDLIPSNILLADPAPRPTTATLLDWEYTGWYLPGFDLALLYTVLGARTPAIRDRIDDLVAAAGIGLAFTANLAMVTTRELRIHHELPASAQRTVNLEILEATWHQARNHLHAIAPRKG